MADEEEYDWFLDPDWASDASSHVVFPNIKDEKSGVAAERTWVTEHFPKHKQLQQRCKTNNANRQIDEIILSAPDGSEISVFFDITDWDGKQ